LRNIVLLESYERRLNLPADASRDEANNHHHYVVAVTSVPSGA
jgi:hypothetical protein